MSPEAQTVARPPTAKKVGVFMRVLLFLGLAESKLRRNNAKKYRARTWYRRIANFASVVLPAIIPRGVKSFGPKPRVPRFILGYFHTDSFDAPYIHMDLWRTHRLQALPLGTRLILNRPGIGPVAKAFGMIPVDREGKGAGKAYGAVIAALGEGSGVSLGTEGAHVKSYDRPTAGTSIEDYDGVTNKYGAVKMAAQSGEPLIPIATFGTQFIRLKPKTWRIVLAAVTALVVFIGTASGLVAGLTWLVGLFTASQVAAAQIAALAGPLFYIVGLLTALAAACWIMWVQFESPVLVRYGEPMYVTQEDIDREGAAAISHRFQDEQTKLHEENIAWFQSNWPRVAKWQRSKHSKWPAVYGGGAPTVAEFAAKVEAARAQRKAGGGDAELGAPVAAAASPAAMPAVAADDELVVPLPGIAHAGDDSPAQAASGD